MLKIKYQHILFCLFHILHILITIQIKTEHTKRFDGLSYLLVLCFCTEVFKCTHFILLLIETNKLIIIMF